jgi:hypothetical protein
MLASMYQKTERDYPKTFIPVSKMRKIIGCFRSIKGAENYQYIASLLATARLQGKNGFEELEKVLRQELCLS